MKTNQKYIRELQESVLLRRQASSQDNLESLDGAVCIAARHLFMHFIDVVAWFPIADRELALECKAELENACNCLEPDAYPMAEAYHRSIHKKVELAAQMAEGKAIKDVLNDAIARSISQGAL